MNNRYLLAIVAMPLVSGPLVSGAAHAQSATPATPVMKSVADRQRPEYLPIGGRLGSFFLYPTLTVTGAATDNARASDADKRDDAFVVANGEAKLVSNWSVHALNTQVYASQSAHTLSTENATQYGAQLDGRYDVSRVANVGLVLRADHLVEDRSSFTSPAGAREPVRYNRARATLATEQDFGRLVVQSVLSYTKVDYDDAVTLDGVPIPQQFRDATILGASGSIAYAVSPGYSVVVSGTADRRRYVIGADDPRQPGNFDRDSSGGRIEAGVRLTLTDLITGEIRAGYLVRDYADPRFRDTSGASFGANVLWNVTPLTSIQLYADRRIDEASSIDVAGNRVTEVTLTVDHELLRNLIVTAYGRYAAIAPLGDFASSSERGARLSARYFVNRQLSLRAAYARGDRSSPDPVRELHENRVSAGVQLSF
ncbi:outer membrane beta-barrel protein [Sphingomonas adhaesiva]|uniref:outer membrane beta-barrel protein n=1 Tax=Sphingomonas adhaesiva TaxID=28212 RepID=UPI002FF55FFA